MIQQFDLETFLDLLADMPDIEAVEELDKRLQTIHDQRKALGDAKGHTAEREQMNMDEDRLRLHRAKILHRIEQRKWSKAVMAIYGQEGMDRCLEWMRLTPEDEVQAIAARRARERKAS